ncbi:MAG: mechanosensitive ion channel family protein [Vicinamibacterales bacterium]
MTDTALRLAIGAAVVLLALIIRAASVNRLVRRKLRLSFFLALIYVVVSYALSRFALSPDMAARVLSVAQLAMALAIINLVVATAINPLRADRVPERFPNIVQDTIIIGLFLMVATVVMQEKFLTTSAVGAVVIGFALQDTLGNMFAGLAIQVEKPFRVGHWVGVGSYEGLVSEVTWRATKLRTKTGNLVVLPNAFISKEAIVNYSEPAVPTRLEVEVGVSYGVPPDQVKAALVEAMGNVPMALPAPLPDAVVADFGASAVIYRVRFWMNDYSKDTIARDQARSAIYYSLRRHGYEIPFPIQTEIHREPESERASERIERVMASLRPLDLFRPLTGEQLSELAARAGERIYGQAEAIVRQGEAGSSMFVVASGRVRVVESSGRELATFEAGGYFGEMSMLTGQPRSATVEAVEQCQIVELSAASLREVALANPEVVTRISAVVAGRQADLDRQKAEAAAGRPVVADVQRSLLTRIQAFLRLPNLLGD